APAGVHGRLQIGQPLRAAVELRGPARVDWAPGPPARLRLTNGWARVTATGPLRLDADGVQLTLESGSPCELELELVRKGEANMTKRWLIPAAAAAVAGGVVTALLVHRGKV